LPERGILRAAALEKKADVLEDGGLGGDALVGGDADKGRDIAFQ
jgi:hypothetical protein